jgi:hypothetical protein
MITTETLDQIKELAKYRHSIRQICLMLGLSREEEFILTNEYEDHNSDVRRAYDMGIAESEKEIDDSLLDQVKAGGEGSGEAASTLSYIRKKRTNNDLKRKLFGV